MKDAILMYWVSFYRDIPGSFPYFLLIRSGLLRGNILRDVRVIPVVPVCLAVRQLIIIPARFPVFFVFRREITDNMHWMAIP
ncbi:MAG: hypothetical protein ACUBOA_11850 [Candidatus Loosdrechtia sp.]|uniref:hypothetical protein n=1 Tax=Candidatus Loosdrechtia sp. TaxID=3101272 RepID=UPI00403B0D65